MRRTPISIVVWESLCTTAVVVGLLLGLAGQASAQTGTLTSLTVANLSPAFSPTVKDYFIPRTAACSVTVTATLATATNRLFIANAETPSGMPRSVWVCDGVVKFSVIVYTGWTEVGRYTIKLVAMPPPPPPPPTYYVTSITAA